MKRFYVPNKYPNLIVKRSPLLIFIILSFFFSTTQAQVGGRSVYTFLNITSSARLSGMGGNFAVIKDNDLSLALVNPSLITPEMSNNLTLNYIKYFSDINYGFAAYSRTFPKIGSFTAGIQYLNYGKFIQADETGQTYGTFHAADYALQIGWGRSLDSSFSVGANLKMIFSDLDSYTSFGLCVDVAGTYFNRKRQMGVSLIARNIGRQIVYYTAGNNEPLPFELQLAFSTRPKHLPFRLSIVLTHLERYNMRYTDPALPTTDPLTGEAIQTSKIGEIADNLMRHVVIGGEFIPIKALSIRLGYNYQRRKEMTVETRKGLTGFSFGIGLKIRNFSINYGRAMYHISGSPNVITLTTDLGGFMKKVKK